MISAAHNSCCAACLCLAALAPAGQAGTVYQWTDAEGHTHFSDAAPDNRASLAIDLPATPPRPSNGLRPGERATLLRIEKRQQSRHKSAVTARRKLWQERESERRACDDKREQLRRGRRYVDSKALSKYLREHCW
jgi:hypothetical protein